jgi:hypothetical protein
MDQTSTNIIAYLAFITTVSGGIYTAINHRRIRSNCCGRKVEASLDIENTTPPRDAPGAPPPPINLPPSKVDEPL